MLRWFTFMSMLAAPAFAIEPCGNEWDGDLCELRESSEGHAAEFFYSNSISKNSHGTHGRVFRLGDVEIRVWVEVGGSEADNAEILRVEAEGFVPFPHEIAVPDGADTVVQIMRPMF